MRSWIFSAECESRLIESEAEYAALVASGWRDTPAAFLVTEAPVEPEPAPRRGRPRKV